MLHCDQRVDFMTLQDFAAIAFYWGGSAWPGIVAYFAPALMALLLIVTYVTETAIGPLGHRRRSRRI